MKASADQECQPTYEGRNVEAQNYSRWANPIQSYLSYENGRGFMRVQAANSIKGVLVEYYDTAFHYQSSLIIPEELPIFGGFYETDANYYLVTGQENMNESAETEVFRITKYDKSWNRIASTGLYDCNTTVPFDAGSLRFAECGKYLLIRTCHEMYKSSDGLNHQANVTIEVDTENMQITDSYTRVMNSSYGYVSHSFNQFIQVENNKIVSLDHGDAHPRSLVLMKYNTDASTGTFTPGWGTACSNTDVMVFPGKTGDNTTGASVGGFAVAEGYYLVAGNSVPQEDTSNLTRKTRNVFVAAVSKDTNEVTIKWLTDYQEGDGTTSTPQMVQTAENEYVILWSRGGTVFYTKVDNSGTPMGEICQLSGNLSDCVPIVAGNRLVWYTWEQEKIRFYEIDLAAFGNSSMTEIQSGHPYVNKGVSDGIAFLECPNCGEQTQIAVPDSMTVFWNTTGSGTYSTAYNNKQDVGAKMYYLYRTAPADTNAEVQITVSNPNLILVEEGVLTMKGDGEATVTFQSKYNPDLKRSFTFTIGNAVEETPAPTTEPTPAPEPPVTETGWKLEEDGEYYWYENGVKQGTEGRGKEIYDPGSDAWYWLDAVQGGKVAKNKDVYQESSGGKWVRYDENGHMIKGWDLQGGNWYYFDLTSGAMVKGNVPIRGINYYFDEELGILDKSGVKFEGWYTMNGKDYWYENDIRQGYDPENPNYRGKEIYDPGTDGWYWLDNVQQGAKAVSKDVYQESYSAYPDREDGTGKWVRYDQDGLMVKGWQTTEQGTYYFEEITGAMAKGAVTIDGRDYYFNPITGIMEE